MTFLDTSVIIDYLEGIERVVAFVNEQETLLISKTSTARFRWAGSRRR